MEEIAPGRSALGVASELYCSDINLMEGAILGPLVSILCFLPGAQSSKNVKSL